MIRTGRICAALAVLCVAGSYLAAQIDHWRRHHPGISPQRYLWPQLTQIWLPGLLAAVALGIIAAVSLSAGRKRSLPASNQPVASVRNL